MHFNFSHREQRDTKPRPTLSSTRVEHRSVYCLLPRVKGESCGFKHRVTRFYDKTTAFIRVMAVRCKYGKTSIHN